jgi:N-acetylneuraminic acid mutarotase
MIKRTLVLLLLLKSVLSPAQNWTSLPDFPGSARDDASGFILGNNFYAGTGLDGGFNATRDFYVFDLVNETWSTGTSMPVGMERQYASGFSVGNLGYIFGGIGPAVRISTISGNSIRALLPGPHSHPCRSRTQRNIRICHR